MGDVYEPGAQVKKAKAKSTASSEGIVDNVLKGGKSTPDRIVKKIV